jgi:hypothetical protein
MPTIRHPKPQLIRLAAILVGLGWVGIVTMFAAIGAGALVPGLRVRSTFLAGLAMLIVGGVGGLGLGGLVQCTECAAALFDQSSGARHSSVRRPPLLKFWAESMLTVEQFRTGVLRVSGRLKVVAATRVELTFEFDSDQSHLRLMVEALRSVCRQFPVRV